MLFSLIFSMVNVLKTVAEILIQFLIIVVLGILAAVLGVIPWLLRIAALLLWLIAAYVGLTTIQKIYAPFSDQVPLLALKFALITLAVAWVIQLTISNSKHFWGGLFVGGLVIGGSAIGANWLTENWAYADLMFRALPPALFCTLLMYETLRLRAMRQSRRFEIYIPRGGELGHK